MCVSPSLKYEAPPINKQPKLNVPISAYRNQFGNRLRLLTVSLPWFGNRLGGWTC
jgi:hypothetical protein